MSWTGEVVSSWKWRLTSLRRVSMDPKIPRRLQGWAWAPGLPLSGWRPLCSFIMARGRAVSPRLCVTTTSVTRESILTIEHQPFAFRAWHLFSACAFFLAFFCSLQNFLQPKIDVPGWFMAVIVRDFWNPSNFRIWLLISCRLWHIWWILTISWHVS